MELMGDPQRDIPVIHITGTNGKTSTARMIERAAARARPAHRPVHQPAPAATSASGSPRRRADQRRAVRRGVRRGGAVPARSSTSARAAGEPVINYFEVLTAMAFAAFADAPVDVAVVEVGLGGTWDATNVADGQVAVITPIVARPRAAASARRSRQIAAEKAGHHQAGRDRRGGAQQRRARPRCCCERAAEVDATVGSRGPGVRGAGPRGRGRWAAGQPARARRRLRGPVPAAARRAPGAQRWPARSPPSRRSSAAGEQPLDVDAACAPAFAGM